MQKKTEVDKAGFAIGGAFMIGLGVGFIFLPGAPLLFVASIICGIGLGLLVAAIITKK